jgi:hypothetical protein
LTPIAEQPAHEEGDKTPLNQPLKLSIPLLDEETLVTLPDTRISLRKLNSVPSGDALNSSNTNSYQTTSKKKETMEEVLASMEREEA